MDTSSALVLPRNPIVEAHNREMAATAEWYRRVREWNETVDAPLDAVLDAWQTDWNQLVDSVSAFPRVGTLKRIVASLRAIADAIRCMEAIRQVGVRWHNGGSFGQFGVPIARLDWCRMCRPLTERCDLVGVHGMRPAESLRIASRLIHLGLTSSENHLEPLVRQLLELPEGRRASAWLPFVRDCLAPWASRRSLNDFHTPELAEEHITSILTSFTTPEPTDGLTAETIWTGVLVGTWAIGEMNGKGFDWFRNCLRERIRSTPRGQPIDSGSDANVTPNRQIRPERTKAVNRKADQRLGTNAADEQRTAVMHHMLRVLIGNGVSRWIETAIGVILDDQTSVDQKLRRLHQLIPLFGTVNGNQLAGFLNVTRQAIVKTPWWKEHGSERLAKKAAEREERLRKKGELYEHDCGDN